MKKFYFMLAAATLLSANVAFAEDDAPAAIPAYTLVPAAGTQYSPKQAENLQGITLSFTETAVYFFENNQMPVAVLENLTTGKIYTCEAADRNTFTTAETEYTLNFLPEGESIQDEDVVLLPITEPGEYLLTVRAMYTGTLGDPEELIEPNYDNVGVILGYYTVEYPVAYTLNPAAGVVESLSAITLQFPENKNVVFYENSTAPLVTLSNGLFGDENVTYTAEIDLNPRATLENGCEYNLVFVDEDGEATTIEQPGNWVLTVKGMYLEGETADDNEDLPVLSAYYTINYPEAYTLTPDPTLQPGEEGYTPLTSLSKITLEFPATKEVVFAENVNYVAALTNGLTGDEEVAYYCYEADRNTNAMTDGISYDLQFVDEDGEPAKITAPGKWYLTIRNLGYENLDPDAEPQTLPDIHAVYTIAYPFYYALEPGDGAVIGELVNVTLEFPTTKNVAFYENSSRAAAVISMKDAEGLEVASYKCQEPTRLTKVMTDGIMWEFVFVDEDGEGVVINEPGFWNLTIAGLYTVDADEEMVDLPVINATYYIDGESSKVTKIEAPEGVFNVYNINGVQLVRNGGVESLNSLPSGLYIINGKKVLVRK